MGSLAKVGAKKASNALREGYGAARDNYPEAKRQVKSAYSKADKLATRSLDYAERVRDNASESSLFKETEAHEYSENLLLGRDHERKEHKKKKRHSGGQHITVNVNSGRRKKKKRVGSNRHSGFSLI